MNENVEVYSLLTEFDIELFQAGRHYRLYEKLGAHTVTVNDRKGVYFAVWAPTAESVSVMGNWNHWDFTSHQLYPRWDGSGIWEGLIYDLDLGEVYKYGIRTYNGKRLEKSDPFGLVYKNEAQAATVVGTTYYEWDDKEWMENRKKANSLSSPFSIYEVHLGSWMRDPSDPERLLGYREMADKLVPYVKEMGFTHVEFLPLMEHPYYPSWGYQIIGYFAASSRYGTPQDLMFLIEEFHKNGIGVIMDWVPSHFPGDAHGLRRFDGTALYEHEDPRQGFHPDWKSYIFNYGRNEVRSYLISNALFWLDRYHIDGYRVDAVASMLYLDYSREDGQWVANKYGGNENLEAVQFLREFNEAVYINYPDVQTIAEESTSWAGVSRPTYESGLGFGMKWMMGWMHDTLNYFSENPINRKYHHDKITFAMIYAFHENFMLPLSHDEVVHGKQSLIYKMPGNEWEKFANLRALYLYMYTFIGAKLVFMGGEFAQTNEWNAMQSLDWHLLKFAPHKGMQEFFKKLNGLYKGEPALYENAFNHYGFEWLEAGDRDNSVFAYLRKGEKRENDLAVVLNLTPIAREDYRIGVPAKGEWEVIFNSDDKDYHGSGIKQDSVVAEEKHWMNQDQSIALNLPPLGGLVLKLTEKSQKKLAKEIEKQEKERLAKEEKAQAAEEKKTKKSTAKKTPAKKAPAKKAPAKKAPAKKTTKATTKKSTAKTEKTKAKATAKKSTKATTKKTAKAVEKKEAAKTTKAAPKKAAAKKTTKATPKKETTKTAAKKTAAKKTTKTATAKKKSTTKKPSDNQTTPKQDKK